MSETGRGEAETKGTGVRHTLPSPSLTEINADYTYAQFTYARATLEDNQADSPLPITSNVVLISDPPSQIYPVERCLKSNLNPSDLHPVQSQQPWFKTANEQYLHCRTL